MLLNGQHPGPRPEEDIAQPSSTEPRRKPAGGKSSEAWAPRTLQGFSGLTDATEQGPQEGRVPRSFGEEPARENGWRRRSHCPCSESLCFGECAGGSDRQGRKTNLADAPKQGSPVHRDTRLLN